MRRRNIFVNTFLNTMFTGRFPLSAIFAGWRIEKRTRSGGRTVLPADTQGTLFFDVVRIIDARRPAMFVLENVKNLKSHDQKWAKRSASSCRRWTNWAMTWLMQK